MTTTVAWWHCFSGIAGDMALGSLVDAGADLDEIRRRLSGLPIDGWSIEARPVLRAGLAATHVHVGVRDSPVVRTHAHIVGLLRDAQLPERAKARALATFGLLAEVEGRLHRKPPAQVHFHEVGGIDAIVDIVGTCLALELLGIDEIYASAVAQGTGMVRAAHGLLPNPTPAVVELLRNAPTYGTDNPTELTTPTGAALLAALGSGWGPMPAMEISTVGRGAGTRDTEGTPNLVQVVIGTTPPAGRAGADAGQELVVLESNVDDVTGEILAHTIEAAMAAGANDAWLTPVIGKKGRPAQVVSVVVEPVQAAEVRRLLMAETGTLGVRATTVQRWAAKRDMVEVTVAGYPVRVKRSVDRVKAEYADTARVAELTGLPAREVARRAEAAADVIASVPLGPSSLRLAGDQPAGASQASEWALGATADPAAGASDGPSDGGWPRPLGDDSKVDFPGDSDDRPPAG